MLADDLEITADVDLPAVFGDLAGAFTDADFGPVRFDASAILDLVAQVGPPDLTGILGAVETISGQLGAGLDVPGGELPGLVGQLTTSLGQIGTVFPDVGVGTDVGLEGLAGRIDTVRAALDGGPLASLIGLIPGVAFGDEVERIGGSLGGLIDLIRTLAGLTATSAITQRLLERAEFLAGRLDPLPARSAADELARHVADTELVAAIRAASPDDETTVAALTARVVAFAHAVFAVHDRWAIGMAFGEAAVGGLDLPKATASLDLARLSLTGVDLTEVGRLVTELRNAGRFFLDLELPIAQGAAGVIDQALGLVGQLTQVVEGYDATRLVAPVQRLAELALGPLEEISRAIETVAGGAASAIRTVRQIVDAVDISGVADAIRVALQPVIDTLDAIEAAVGDAQDVLEEVAGAITGTLGEIAEAVETAAETVNDALGRVSSALTALDLAGLAENLGETLRTVAAALASAQLTPYFDTAIDIIDTSADVVDAVPFELLPTDIQQEIVDACKPVKELDLQPVEDTLRGELAEIRDSLRADALDAVAEAYAAVVTFLASLDPEPPLVELEGAPMQALRDAVAAIDPESLLAPAEAAIDDMRAALEQIDLTEAVLGPLDGVFQPLLDALASFDPAALLEPVTAEIDRVQALVADLLQLDAIESTVTGFRDRVAAALARLEPAALAGVLDDAVSTSLAALPAGPPGGPFGSLLVSLAQASGLDATEGAVGDTIAWVGGREDGAAEVRARMGAVAGFVAATRDTVRDLDPGPLIAAAAAQQRALAGALEVHAPGTRLRLSLDPVLAGLSPSEVLGPLAENRRRYLLALDVAALATADLAASGRSEVSAAAAELRAALLPLDAFPAKFRALLAALGIEGSDAPLRQLFATLYEQAGPQRLVPALSGLFGAGRDKVLAVLDALLAPVLDAVTTVRGIVDAFDLTPIVDELTALHAQITSEIAALTPAALIGPVLAEADAVIERVAGFDPLAPVRDIIDGAKEAADAVLESARPTVVFAPVIEIHHEVVGVATGLDVATLLRPVIDALDSIGGQLDEGFDLTIDALQRLQAALPSEVSASSVSGSIDVEVGIG